MNNLKSCFLKMTFACLFMAFTMYAEKPQLKGDDLVCNGESFFEASNICSELSRLAREDGVLPANESFKQIAKSGQSISVIMGLYKNCNPKPKYLVTDGGGIDMMDFQGQCGNNPTVNCPIIKNALSTLEQYIDEMKKGGTKKFIFMRYPDPLKQYANSNLRRNLDVYCPEVEKICKASTDPQCLWVDLRTTWGNNESFTTDGIHCTDAGGTATAVAFWNAMKADNYAFFDTLPPVSVPKQSVNNSRGVSGQILSQVMKNGNLSVSLSVDQPSDIRVKLTTVSGRSVFTSQKHTAVCGKQDVVFPTGKLARGIYCCEIKTGTMINQSTLLVP